MDTAAELRPHHRRCEPWTNADVGVVLGLAFLAACICAVAILRRPDINASATFLFSDPGVNLLLAERLTSGDLLFRDVAFSYGPLAIYPFALFAKVFGDTPQSYGAFLAIVSVVNVALAYVVLRRQVSRASAVIVSIGGIVPTMLIPGSLVFGIHSSTYFVLERALFLLLLLAWEPPGRRTTRSAVRMGLLLGLGQGVRFGTALFLGLAVVVIDVLALLLVRADLKAIHQWVRTRR